MEPNLSSLDYYEVLGLKKECDPRDIKIAYRRLAKKYHPDKSPDSNAQRNFVIISRAYETLSNSDERMKYDQGSLKEETKESRHSYTAEDIRDYMAHWADFFENAFSDPKGEDVHVYCRLTLEELKRGCKKVITLNSGKISIKIKPDSSPNSTLKIEGKGKEGTYGTTKGDLYINLVPKPHPVFKLSPNGDILLTKKISYPDLLLGTPLIVETLKSKVKIMVPKLTNPYKDFRLKGQGLSGKDLILKLEVLIPEKLSLEEEKVLKTLSKSKNFKSLKT
jgi:curved DNA-binding protein